MSTGQSRNASLFQTLTKTALGSMLSAWVQRILARSLGHELLLVQNLFAASASTAISLIRNYVVRRLCNAYRDDLP